LFEEVIGGWRASGKTVTVEGEQTTAITVSIEDTPAVGTMPGLLSWMTGRGSSGVSPAEVEPAPAWL
jgi:hypothetical protein